MEPESQPGSGFESASFAGLLAALAAPRPQPRSGFGTLVEDGPEGSGRDGADLDSLDLDSLKDDVATLSYERALKTHARYGRTDLPPSADARMTPEIREGADGAAGRLASRASQDGRYDPEANRKRASVTIRMSRAECARMQQRATEAGLTVSAYLRFCALEVESLRAQVKTAMAELRGAQAAPEPAASFKWLRRLWPHA